MKKQGFLSGALILMAANAVSKLLGAVLKIPLTYILREEGMAVYNTAFTVYIMFLSFVISGLPFAVSKSAAAGISRGEYVRTGKTVGISAVILAVLGAAATAAMYFLAPFLAAAMKEPSAGTAIRIISPSVLLVALGAAYKSYFQGAGNMIPVAISQVTEAAVKLAAGIGGAWLLAGTGAELTSAGAISGVTLGEAWATLMLFLAYLFRTKVKSAEVCGRRDILRELSETAIPLTAMAVSLNGVSMLEQAVVRNSLLLSGIGAEKASFLYGAYTGYALTVFHLPAGIFATVGVSLLPVIAGAAATNNRSRAAEVSEMSVRLIVNLSVPCAVVMAMMSDELLYILFHNTASSKMLMYAAPGIIPVCITQLISAILQSASRIAAPFWVMLASSAVKIILCRLLCADFGIYGAIAAANISSAAAMAAEWIMLKKFMSLKFSFMEIIIKPAAAAGAMIVTLYVLKTYGSYGNVYIGFVVNASIACAVYLVIIMDNGQLIMNNE